MKERINRKKTERMKIITERKENKIILSRKFKKDKGMEE